MTKETWTKIKALFELHKESHREGRPIAGSQGDYMPNHHFSWMPENVMVMGPMYFPKNLQWIYPGECSEVEIILHTFAVPEEQLKPGLKWEVKEGPYTVGDATLLEIIEDWH